MNKVKILREVLEEGKGVSAVAETYNPRPNNSFGRSGFLRALKKFLK